MKAEMCTPESPTCDGHRNGRSWLLLCPQPSSSTTDCVCNHGAEYHDPALPGCAECRCSAYSQITN